ncbi:MAG: MBL fold metallo-hydrolase, partial [Anaerolineae bacterium]|nr:MBL fold metallo-hydrolase [Anaerolineae bacterium]
MKNSARALSRRDMLRMAGAGALGVTAAHHLGFNPQHVFAQGQSGPAPIAFFTKDLGDIRLTIIRDRIGALDPAVLGANAPEGAVAELLAQSNLPTNQVNNTFNVALLQAGDRLALLDTGNGVAQGSLVATLGLLGIARDAITDVVISHIHPDHITGALDGGNLTFPNAMYHYPEAEKAVVDAAGSDGGMMDNNKAILSAADAAGQLDVFTADVEVLPGVTAIAAPGHTAGHTAFRLDSGGASLLCTVDSAIHPVVSLAMPDWHAA